MNYPGVDLTHPDLLEEGWRELERECERRRQVQEARAARRAERPSRFTTLTARVRHALHPDPCTRLAEGC